MSVAGRGIAPWLIGLCLILASALAPTPARAQALFPGGCPVVFDAFGGATVTYSFPVGSSGAFTDAGGAVCRGIGQPGVWRYYYTYTVTSTLVDATFRITSPHEGGVDITAPGTYELTARVFPGGEDQFAARSYGDHPDNGAEPYDEDVFGPLNYPALGLGYSTTATGPNPSGTVTVTFRGVTTDVPGSRVFVPTTPGSYYTGFLSAATGVLRDGFRPSARSIGAPLLFLSSQPYLLQPGASYTFTENPHADGLLHSVTCSAGSATIGADNASFTLTGQADRSQVNCALAHAQRPSVTALSTATGPPAGGTVVTVTGTNLTGVTAVRFGANAATSFTVNSATSLTATAPAGTAGLADVIVSTGALPSANTAADDYTYLNAIPTAGAVSATVAYNSPGQAITLTPGGAFTSVSVVAGPTSGGVTLSGTSATYVPNSGFIGTDSFTYRASGAGGDSAPATVSITVAAPPAPSAGSVATQVAFNSPGQAIALAPGGVFSSLAIAQGPTNGSVSLSGTTATYAPRTGFFGTDGFTYTATGPGGTSSAATVAITVPTPPAPTINPPAVVAPPTTVGGAFSVDLGSTSSGVVDGFRLTALPSGGDATIEEESGAVSVTKGGPQALGALRFRLVYRPRSNFLGQDRVTLVGFGPGGTSAPATFLFNVTGKAPDLSGRSASNATVRLSPITGLSGGPFQAVRVTQAPTYGTVTVQGLDLVFTPALADSGSTSFAYVIDLPFGSSAPGTARVVTDLAPIPAALAAATQVGRPVTVDLTSGARGGPFTGAAVLALTPSGAGTATIVEGGAVGARTYALTFTPAARFTGVADVAFSLTNAAATGNGSLRLTVTPRPDPTLDPEVRVVVVSQVDSARRFADTQTANFSRRLAAIRDGSNESRNDLSLNLGFAQSRGWSPRGEGLTGLVRDVERDRWGPVLDRDRQQDTLWAPTDPPGPGRDRLLDERIGVWAAGTVDWGHRDAQSGARDYRITTQGLSAGIDMRITPDLILGVGAGYGRDRTEIGDHGSRSEGRGVSGALYGGWQSDSGLFVDGALGRMGLDFDSRRWIAATGSLGQGQREGAVTFGSMSAGWTLRRQGFNGEAYVRAERQAYDLDAFTETGIGTYALTYQALTFDSLSSVLGVRGGWSVPLQDGRLLPRLQVEWAHEFEDQDPQRVRFADLVDSPIFALYLNDLRRDQWSFDLGLEWARTSGLSLSLGYRAQTSPTLLTQGLDFTLRSPF